LAGGAGAGAGGADFVCCSLCLLSHSRCWASMASALELAGKEGRKRKEGEGRKMR